MQKQPKGPLALGLLTMSVGIGWFLTVKSYVPDVNWIWTLGLAVVGLLTFVISGGLDKVSVIVGPFFLVGGLLSLARQTDRLDANLEAPVLVTLVGLLLLVAQLRAVPLPKWVNQSATEPEGDR